MNKLDAIRARAKNLMGYFGPGPTTTGLTTVDYLIADICDDDIPLLLAVAEAAAALIDEGAPSRTHEYAGLECVYCGAVWYARGIEHKADCLWLLAKAALAPLMQEEGE